MFCTKCGTAIRNNYNFCENCGKMLAPCSQMPRPLPYEVDLDKISMSGSSSNPPAPGASQVFRYNGNSYAQGRPNYRNQTVSPRKDILDSFWFIMNLVGIFIGCIVFLVSLLEMNDWGFRYCWRQYSFPNGDLSRTDSALWVALFGVGTMLGCLINLIIISVRQHNKRRQ